MAYVYKHVRLDKNEPFYIGISKSDDINFDRAYSKHGRNKIWKGIVKKTDYVVEIVYSEINIKVAFEKEIELIKFHGRIDLKTGTLTNLTSGGEGGYGLGKPIYCKNLDYTFINMVECSNKFNISVPELKKILSGNKENLYNLRFLNSDFPIFKQPSKNSNILFINGKYRVTKIFKKKLHFLGSWDNLIDAETAYNNFDIDMIQKLDIFDAVNFIYKTELDKYYVRYPCNNDFIYSIDFNKVEDSLEYSNNIKNLLNKNVPDIYFEKRKEKLIGTKYSRLTIIDVNLVNVVKNNNIVKRSKFIYKCDCGNLVEHFDLNLVKRGGAKSCGCIRKELLSKKLTTHGNSINHKPTITYIVWNNIKSKKKICNTWYEDFNNFLIDMGERPSKDYSLLHVDKSKEYSKDNCKWVYDPRQTINKDNVLFFTYNNINQSLGNWCAELGLNYKMVLSRLKRGWSFEQAIKIPKGISLKRFVS